MPAAGQKRPGPQAPPETQEQKMQRIAETAEGPTYNHVGPGGAKPSEAQQAAYGQAAAAYAAFAAQAMAQAKAAQEAAGYYAAAAKLNPENPLPMLTAGPGVKTPESSPFGQTPAAPQKSHGEGNAAAKASGNAYPPKKVKVLMGATDREMEATWQTGLDSFEGPSEVYWGIDTKFLKYYSSCKPEKDEDAGVWKHSVKMENLRTQTRYYFLVGDHKNGFSPVYRFKTQGEKMPDQQTEMATPDPVEPTGWGADKLPQGALPGRGQFGVERRIDPADGRAYTEEEFRLQYKGNMSHWQNASRLGYAGAPQPGMAGVQAAAVVPGNSSSMWGAGVPQMASAPGAAQMPAQIMQRPPDVMMPRADGMAGRGITATSTPPGFVRMGPGRGQLTAGSGKNPGFQVSQGKDLPQLGKIGHQEQRYDPNCPDGKVYTLAEFRRQYGTSDKEWEVAPRLHEKRVDATDGKAYEFAEFKAQYGDKAKSVWDESKIAASSQNSTSPALPKGPVVRLKNFGRKPPNGAASFFAKRLKNFRSACLPDPSKVVELPCDTESDLLVATPSKACADGMIEMINVARDFNTQLFPNLTALIETDDVVDLDASGKNEAN